MNNNGKIAVIGSDSYIASKFIEAYLSYDMKLFSVKSSGKQNEIIKNDLFDISEEDLSGCDIVINFAAIVHRPELKDYNLYKKINTDLPVYIAETAKKSGVRHFIQMSSVAVYGNIPYIDENTEEKPADIYAYTKLNADKALYILHDAEFTVSLIRPPMVYGGGAAPGNMKKLIAFANSGIPLPFKGVKNSRDFLHVNNLVNALQTVIENSVAGIVIPTDKNSVSTEDIILYIKKYSDSEIRMFKLPTFLRNTLKKIKPEIYRKLFASLKIKCNLNDDLYLPKYSVEDGIKEMVKSI